MKKQLCYKYLALLQEKMRGMYMSFISYLINGLSLGSVYAIIALGYTMVYGIAKMLNFAHGDVIMIGAYVTLMGMTKSGLSPIVSVLIAVVVCTALGMVIERVAYKPLRNAASPLAVLITAIGVSYLLQNVALLIFGANAQSFPSAVKWEGISLADGALNVSGETIVTIVICVVIMVVLMTFIKKSKAGQAMRAVSEDKGAAQLMGINVNGTIALTFAIGSALAAIAGVLLCSAYPSLTPYTGAMPGIKAFVAAVFGGIGSIPGAFIGGILLGIIEILGKAYISSQMADAIVFAVLIIVLLVKPTGLLGKNIQEKV
ncbi:branched-chain amino acid ABC transporter, permease protein [Blautia hydrogenotrophica DSM 10507]|uniref:LIV-I protein H n=2 Tax=Blautia hydrogenotrophica TaxID=53443 RepID=C0CLT2_BLAHS|nr:branched-chain amino acid ABC transporter, permease protein [Blautia hydrogenotrophica DSM 10507]